MFHTEELKQVIDQLQSSHGASLGYFDTLLLITKLIGTDFICVCSLCSIVFCSKIFTANSDTARKRHEAILFFVQLGI